MSNEKTEAVEEAASDYAFSADIGCLEKDQDGYDMWVYNIKDVEKAFVDGANYRDKNLPISEIVEFAVKYVAENGEIDFYGWDCACIDKDQILSLIPEITQKYNEQA